MEGRETDLEYNLLMGLTGASVSKHLLDEHFTLLWANDFYYDMIGYPKEEYEALLIKKTHFVFHNHHVSFCGIYVCRRSLPLPRLLLSVNRL